MHIARLRTPAFILAGGCLIACISYGLRAGMGLYLQPISIEYGWGRSIFSNAIAIQMLILGLLGPFAGALADRFGAPRIIAVGALLYAGGLFATAYIRSPVMLYIVSGLVIGTALACTSFAIVFAVVGRVVAREWRSSAFGFVTAAGSFGQFAVLPITQFMIVRYGWQAALVASAVVSGLIIVLAMFLGHDPGPANRAETRLSVGEALREAWTERSFHLLFWGFAVCGFQVTMFSVHLPALVSDSGLTPTHGVTALAIIGLFNIVGCIFFGWLGGRFSKKLLLAALYMVRAILIGSLVTLPISPALLYIFACGMGFLWLSTVPLTNGVVGQVFGLQYMGMLGSIVFLGHQIGSSAGVLAAGYLYDATGRYTDALILASSLGVLAAVLNLPINERPIAERVRRRGLGATPAGTR